MTTEPNLRVLSPSRRKLRAGDLFTLSPSADRFLFGRIVSTDAVAGPMTGLNLIYVYDVERESPDLPPDDSITTEHLLLPPMLINRLPWSRGYFETVAHRPLEPQHRLPQQRFQDSRGRCFDEHGNEVNHPTEPLGFRGVQSFRTVDDGLSAALGIPLAAD